MNKISYLIFFLLLSVTAGATGLTITTQDTSICPNESVWLKADGVDLYFWGDPVNLDTVMGDSVNFSASAPGLYSISVLGVIIGVDTDTVTISIRVNALPTGSINSTANVNNDFICAGDSATLSVTGNGFSSFAWSPTNGLSSATGQSVKASPSIATTYVVTITDTNGCQNTANKLVKVNATAPTVNMTAADTSVCLGSSVQLSANGNGLLFNWASHPSLSGTNTKTVTATPTATTTYSVTATLNGCTNTGSIQITVEPTPSLTVSENSNGQALCLDTYAIITTVCPTCDYYIYKLPSSLLETTSTSQIVTSSTPGAIEFKVTGVSANECRASEVVTIDFDSCFIGSPFSIEELSVSDLNVLQNGSFVQISLPAKMTSVEVYDLLGSRVGLTSNINSTKTIMNVSSLSTGIYILVVKSEKGELTKKLYLN